MLGLTTERETVQNFLEWLLDERGLSLAKHAPELRGGLYPIWDSREKLIAAYFDIDLTEWSLEKQRMLDEIRAMNDRTPKRSPEVRR